MNNCVADHLTPFIAAPAQCFDATVAFCAMIGLGRIRATKVSIFLSNVQNDLQINDATERRSTPQSRGGHHIVGFPQRDADNI